MERHRAAALEYIRRVKPKLIIGSPECTMFSTLQKLSGWNANKTEQLVEAKKHIEFVVQLYKEQIENGRWFLHEHPHQATSWDLEEIKKLEKELNVQLVVADQCMYGLRTRSRTDKGFKPARKRTKFMTNSPEIARVLNKLCPGHHDHEMLTGWTAKVAAKYPEPLCKAICTGLINEMRAQQEWVRTLMTLVATDTLEQIKELQDTNTKYESEAAFDDVTGEGLEPREVKKARKVEIEYARKKSVWKIILRKDAIARGLQIIQTRWIDVNQGDTNNPMYRSRFVAEESND